MTVYFHALFIILVLSDFISSQAMFLSLPRKLFAKPRLSCVRVKHFMRTFSDDHLDSFFDDEDRDLVRVREERAKVFLNNLDDELKEKKKTIESFINKLCCEDNILVPDKLRADDWMKLLLQCSTETQFSKCLHSVVRKERRRSLYMMQKMENRKLIEKNNELFDHLYHLDAVRDLHIHAWKKLMAWRSENPIVIDLDFPEIEGRRERFTIQDIKNAINLNLLSPEPSNIHLTSFRNFDQMTDYYNAKSSLLACTFCEDHFLDLFPREKIIYLSSYAPPMLDFDPDAVYVVGGLQTRGLERLKLSHTRAQKYGVKCASFPLMDFVRLKVSSSYTLCIDTSVSIINSMYLFHCWKKAFRECLDPNLYRFLDENVVKNPRRARMGSKIHLQTINDKVLSRLQKITQKMD